jgi:hypothetical protein
MTALTRLAWTDNNFEGTIPTQLARLTNLQAMSDLSILQMLKLTPLIHRFFHNNKKMNGTIPTGIFQPKLTELSVAGNRFTGNIPTQIGVATTLRVL